LNNSFPFGDSAIRYGLLNCEGEINVEGQPRTGIHVQAQKPQNRFGDLSQDDKGLRGQLGAIAS
jgi:hypothetical protein